MFSRKSNQTLYVIALLVTKSSVDVDSKQLVKTLCNSRQKHGIQTLLCRPNNSPNYYLVTVEVLNCNAW